MNRACLYGDGFFETIWVKNDEIPLFDYHWLRARNTAEELRLIWPVSLTESVLKEEILKSCNDGKTRCRVTFYRKGGGHYIPESLDMAYDIESHHYKLPDFATGINNLIEAKSTDELKALCLALPLAKAVYYEPHKKNSDRFSSIKGISAQFYVQAGIFAKEKECEDAVLFNKELKVAELLLGNIIVVQNNQWYTPDLDQGGVDGVMRSYLMSKFKNITLTPINRSHMENADLLLGCNALRGLYRLYISN